MDIKKIKHKGVEVLSDLCLYDNNNEIVLLSLYGATQQVKAIFAAIASGYEINVEDSISLQRVYSPVRFRGTSIGYGKQHGLIYAEDLAAEKYVIWRNPNERVERLIETLSGRRIPILKEWMPWLEGLLKENEVLLPLHGWGGEGYECMWDDNYICTLITQYLEKMEVEDGKN